MIRIHKQFKPLCTSLVLSGLNSLFGCGFFLFFCATGDAAEPPWTQIHAQHFIVITDAGDKRGREVALRFEQMRAVFGQLLMKNRLNMPVPLTIIALKNERQYAQTVPGPQVAAPGFFLPGNDQNFIVLNLAEDEPWRAVAHDFAHLLLNYNYPLTQVWFDEGFAEYFSSIRVGDKQVEIGGDPELGVPSKDIPTNQMGAANQLKPLTELLNTPVWLSISELFAPQRDSSGYQEGTRHTLFYAQSWIFMHYLLNRNKLQETGTYFDLVQNQKVPVEEAIQKAYGMTAPQFEQAVKDYFRSLAPLFQAQNATNPAARKPVYQFPTPIGPDDIGASATQVLEVDARAMLADVKARIPDRREQGMKDLQSLAAAPNDNEVAHRALAWAHIQRKDFNPAAEELSKAAELNPRDPWTRYYLSVLKYRVAQTNREPMQSLANMMQDLRAVLDWYPEFAEAYNMLAMGRVEGGGNASALESIRAAIRLSPRNEQYVYNLGEIYLSGKKWDAARAVFERLKSSSNPQIATAARRRMDDMEALKKYGVQPQRPVEALNEPPPISKETSVAKPKSVAKPEPAAKEEPADLEATQQTAQKTKPTEPAPATGPIQFVKGKLVSVDCSQAPSAMLTIAAGAKTLHLHTRDYKSLTVVGADAFSCEWGNRSVSVNYRAAGKSDGDLVSVEVH